MLSENVINNLIEEMKHGQIRSYDSSSIHKIESETKSLVSKARDLHNQPVSRSNEKEKLVNFALLKAYIDRNKRVIAAYKFHRIIWIQKSLFSKNVSETYLSEQERSIRQRMLSTTEEYLGSYGSINFFARNPIHNLFVQVLIKEDCGVLLVHDSLLELKKNHIYFLKKTEIADLIDNNLAEII
ncbi:GINS complex subunit 1 [Enteropsectra breve]|nr:GINS complex subunit 1 [Enteropsectra breve]